MNAFIETENLILRKFLPSDAKAVSEYSQQPSVAHWLSDMILETEEKALGWMNWINSKISKDTPFFVLAMEQKAEKLCIGLVGIAPKDELNGEIELLFGVSDLYQKRGYATEASQALITYMFQITNLDSLSAIVKPDNIPSKKVLQKLGFVYHENRILPYDGEMCTFEYYTLKKA